MGVGAGVGEGDGVGTAVGAGAPAVGTHRPEKNKLLQGGVGNAGLSQTIGLLQFFYALYHGAVIAVRQVERGKVAKVIHGLLEQEHISAAHALL